MKMTLETADRLEQQSVIDLRLRRTAQRSTFAWLAVLRVAFGAVWAADASLKWQPAFQSNFMQLLSGVAQGQPGFLSWWFALWQAIVSGRAPILAFMTASTETYLALAVLTGFARKITYSVGLLYGLFVW